MRDWFCPGCGSSGGPLAWLLHRWRCSEHPEVIDLSHSDKGNPPDSDEKRASDG